MARCRWFEEDLGLKVVFWFVAQVHDHSLPPNTTDGQSYLDELVADGKTAPKAAMTGSSTFRIKCGEDGDFTGIHLMSHTNRILRYLHRVHARRRLVSPTLETTSPACHRFSTSGFSGRCPTRRSCDELLPERLQIVLFTLMGS